MKKGILIALMLLAAQFATAARAEGGPVTLLLAGTAKSDVFKVTLSPDGRDYVINSFSPLEAGGDLCSHPGEDPYSLVCSAPGIAGFEVNLGGGEDVTVLTPDIPIPATLRGGPGDDRLQGGDAADKLVGGAGNDKLSGRRGDDWIFGGPGNDHLLGGAGNDQLRGGPGADLVNGGPGQNSVLQ